MKRFLKVEVLTSVVTAVLACGIGAALLRQGADRQIGRQVSPGYKLPALGGYAWGSHERTLLLALRAGCPYCQESMPFYERLLGMENCDSTSAHLVAVFPDALATVERSLPGGLRGIEALPNVDLGALAVVGTPTLILVDASGRAQEVWIGRLSGEQEGQVLQAVRRRGRSLAAQGQCADKEALPLGSRLAFSRM